MGLFHHFLQRPIRWAFSVGSPATWRATHRHSNPVAVVIVDRQLGVDGATGIRREGVPDVVWLGKNERIGSINEFSPSATNTTVASVSQIASSSPLMKFYAVSQFNAGQA